MLESRYGKPRSGGDEGVGMKMIVSRHWWTGHRGFGCEEEGFLRGWWGSETVKEPKNKRKKNRPEPKNSNESEGRTGTRERVLRYEV